MTKITPDCEHKLTPMFREHFKDGVTHVSNDCQICGDTVNTYEREIPVSRNSVACEPPCGPDACTRRGGAILCRYDSDWWSPGCAFLFPSGPGDSADIG